MQDTEPQIAEQRTRVAALVSALQALEPRDSDVEYLLALSGSLVRKGVWIVGGDGWAYDIGFGGLDHVLSSGRNVNVLCLDTEVYSNTGGQASKSTSRGAVAKFASRGKGMAKKDLGAIARSYGDVYVAQIALGANDAQSIRALLEAEAWPGPSLVIAYSTCISHGIDMTKSMAHQKEAVRSGYWNLYRYQPTKSATGQPFNLDSKEPSLPVREFVMSEARYAILSRTDPARAKLLMELAQADIDERWRYYRQLGRHRAQRRRRSRKRIRRRRPDRRQGGPVMSRLATTYLGLELRSPLVASSSPLTGKLATARRLEAAGASAIVLPSLFEEEINQEDSDLVSALEQAPRASPRRSTTSPTSATTRTPPRTTSPTCARPKRAWPCPSSPA